MIDDMKKYNVERKQAVIAWYRKNGDRYGMGKSISIQAQSTSCPCIIVAMWLGEEFGWPDELLHSIKVLTKFYGYSEIRNKPASCPV